MIARESVESGFDGGQGSRQGQIDVQFRIEVGGAEGKQGVGLEESEEGEERSGGDGGFHGGGKGHSGKCGK